MSLGKVYSKFNAKVQAFFFLRFVWQRRWARRSAKNGLLIAKLASLSSLCRAQIHVEIWPAFR